MKKAIFLFLFLLTEWPARASLIAPADSVQRPGSWAIAVQANHGFVMAHRPSIRYLQRDHLFSTEVSWYLRTAPTADWQSVYNFPNIGISYRYIDFGNREILGSGHCIYPQLLFPLLKRKPLHLQARVGVGIGLVTRRFDTENNYKNLAIGSRINGTVLFGLQGRIFPARRLQILAGIDFVHLSNSAARLPNLGLNMPMIYTGLLWYGGAPVKTIRQFPERRPAHHAPGIYYAMGFNEKYPPGGPKYLVHILNGNYEFSAGRKGLFGGGMDFIFDTSLPAELQEKGMKDNYFEDATRIGLYGSMGLRIADVDLLFQTGVYLYNNEKSDGDIYSRLALRYHFHQHFYGGIHLKTHFGRADYTEWALGYIF